MACQMRRNWALEVIDFIGHARVSRGLIASIWGPGVPERVDDAGSSPRVRGNADRFRALRNVTMRPLVARRGGGHIVPITSCQFSRIDRFSRISAAATIAPMEALGRLPDPNHRRSTMKKLPADHSGVSVNSTRRFWERPLAVTFDATGLFSPYPRAATRSGFTPWVMR
jgi:hypothetical protein